MKRYELSITALLDVDAENPSRALERVQRALQRELDESGVCEVNITACRPLTVCRCCHRTVLDYIAGSSELHHLCDECGRLKCDACADEVRAILRQSAPTRFPR